LGKQSLEKQRDCLVTIRNNNQRVMTMIEDLLITARLEAKREDFHMEEFSLVELLRETVDMYGPLSRQKGLSLQLVSSPSRLEVWADRAKVSHVLQNLISNALKFTEKGMIRVEARDASKRAVEIRVSDSGIGIPAELRSKIFEKFYRTQAGAQKAKGTGLGLFIAKELVEGQGGKISVSESQGGGSCFAFTLLKQAPSPSQTGSQSPSRI
jgi:signal transduction histidine kinase